MLKRATVIKGSSEGATMHGPWRLYRKGAHVAAPSVWAAGQTAVRAPSSIQEESVLPSCGRTEREGES